MTHLSHAIIEQVGVGPCEEAYKVIWGKYIFEDCKYSFFLLVLRFVSWVSALHVLVCFGWERVKS